MTSLERALASILESIERARVEKDALALARLMQRKETICAVLAAPENWQDPRERAAVAAVAGHIVEHASMPLVA